MSSESRLASRHPKVVLLYQDKENTDCLDPLILDISDEYRALKLTKTIAKDIKQLSPHVIIFALDTVFNSTKTYLHLVENNILRNNHFSILLCSNKESGLAFQACVRELFDDYFVYQPLYEKFRLKLIIHHGLKQCRGSYQFDQSQIEKLNAQNEEFTQLIEQGFQCRQELVDTVTKSKNNISTQTQSNKNDEQQTDAEQDLKNKLMAEINEHHLAPMFKLLESNIASTMNSLIQSLTKQQQTHLTQTQASISASNKNERSNYLDNSELQKFIHSLEAFEQKNLPKKILVVEDNSLYREMISSVLTKEHFEVDEAEDGLKAIRKIKENNYSLIIMDLFMPHLDGLNTTKHIRLLPNGKNTPIIALSGNKNKQLVQKWASHGLAGYIMKPSTKTQILDTVEKALS
ncbi:response regulator [Pseudoalteromonas tunicata]|uniref:Response regulator n=1 Tax=Pseudoalteromonas tunicata D2 TaxID=87626 RepID=A4CCE2_9GAMM|nr:response regulator [Pseudoalteromonas tunicata]ATC93740.1 hypothetical protein PTUN_a1045 [Pseudoalteromonas tunicata]AXT29565.1 response regulator [Pseudoalteromonas tunicata]EAR27235.1 response regulator [Pseudoalteromonas tunicata D2]MDP4984486.1 response regulator [Pseudoalteromonas tunicata]